MPKQDISKLILKNSKSKTKETSLPVETEVGTQSSDTLNSLNRAVETLTFYDSIRMPFRVMPSSKDLIVRLARENNFPQGILLDAMAAYIQNNPYVIPILISSAKEISTKRCELKELRKLRTQIKSTNQ